MNHVSYFVLFFFFQAEDGIRGADVTGVQTCALPILKAVSPPRGLCGRRGWHFADSAAIRWGRAKAAQCHQGPTPCLALLCRSLRIRAPYGRPGQNGFGPAVGSANV